MIRVPDAPSSLRWALFVCCALATLVGLVCIASDPASLEREAENGAAEDGEHGPPGWALAAPLAFLDWALAVYATLLDAPRAAACVLSLGLWCPPSYPDASSLVVVKDFWNSKLGQLTIHAGQPWGSEKERGPQFIAISADAAPPPDTVPVYDWWSARQRQLTFHAGEPRPGEERHAVQFFAYPADRSPPWGTVAVYEFSNSKLRHMTVHPGEPWPDETRGEMLFHALPPPEQPQ